MLKVAHYIPVYIYIYMYTYVYIYIIHISIINIYIGICIVSSKTRYTGIIDRYDMTLDNEFGL